MLSLGRSIRIMLKCKKGSWCQRIAWYVGKHPHLHTETYEYGIRIIICNKGMISKFEHFAQHNQRQKKSSLFLNLLSLKLRSKLNRK